MAYLIRGDATVPAHDEKFPCSVAAMEACRFAGSLSNYSNNYQGWAALAPRTRLGVAHSGQSVSLNPKPREGSVHSRGQIGLKEG